MSEAPRTGIRRAYRAFILGVLVGCLLLLPLVLWGTSPEPHVLVDVRLPLRSEGLVVPFTLPAGAKVTFDVDLPAMLESDVAIGPLYVALRPELVLEPDAREDRSRHVKGGATAPFTETFEKAGSYALRIPAIPTAMGMESEMFVHARITLARD